MKTSLAQEIHNRFIQLSLDELRDPGAALIRITVQVTLELMRYNPESISEFLRMPQPRSLN